MWQTPRRGFHGTTQWYGAISGNNDIVNSALDAFETAAQPDTETVKEVTMIFAVMMVLSIGVFAFGVRPR